ncbi:MAG: TetR/AcrR family transcriptional regulator C-terminal ligand-binding domain-containing protein [Nostocaceae cyanobacterium]|nr:TetR/AcrR family transcriptional regulator C-terminal ligand-binding domain-containing protein [Nostocaceae cyanobacterium]
MLAIATRARVGKTTIYRRYKSKEELVADAIESLREDVIIPDTGSFWGDIEALIQGAAQITLTPLGRQTVAMIISSATTNPQFAQVYWTKYLQPRRQAFAVVLERAKARQEVQTEVDSNLVFDIISSVMLYALVFPPMIEPWEVYVSRALKLALAKL